MKKFFLLLPVVMLALSSCDSEKEVQDDPINNGPAKEQWSKTFDGADGTVPQYPDLYSHYWQYVWSTKDNPTLILKIHGAFPHCTYFSFSLYDDADGSVINGSSDYQITPDAGSVNPFVETSSKENYYTVYIVPESVSDEKLAEFGATTNVIKVSSAVEQANIMIRQYLSVDQNGNSDEFGGVDMPSIQAYDITTKKEVLAPKTLEGNVNSNVPAFKDRPEIDDRTDIPFLLYPTTSFYPNSATNYLYARTKVTDDQVLTLTFIPTPTPSKVEEYASAKARYWSICLGSCMDTRSYASINNKQANVKNGEKVTFVICTKQNAKLAEIEARVKAENEKGNNTQILVWDSSILSYYARTEDRKDANGNPETIGNTMIIMYRNILPDKTWEHSMAKMTPILLYNLLTAKEDPMNCIAKYALGEYGPQGVKVSTDQFLGVAAE